MFRRPFEIKNSIEEDNFGVSSHPISFEETIAAGNSSVSIDSSVSRFRSKWFFVIAAIAIVVGIGRLYQLSIMQHEYYSAIAEGNRLRVEYVPAPRGIIYDTNKKVIAGNKASFELVVNPLDLPEDQAEKTSVINKVSSILQADPAEIENIINQTETESFQSYLVKQNIPRDQALIFDEQAKDFPGFRVVKVPIREYHDPLLYSHLFGYVGKINKEEYAEKSDEGYLFNDTLGKTGLEFVYENYLRGQFGERQFEVDAHGVLTRVFGEKSAIPGNDIVLNIDSDLQKKLYDELSGRLRQINRQRAAAIAMDPRNGRILAMVNLPSFDDNKFAEGISPDDYSKLSNDPNKPFLNRAISGRYPPGSTVKPMVAAAALQEGVADSRTIIDDKGYIVVPNPYGGADYVFHGYNRSGLGKVNIRSAIALSSDIFFYIMGGGYEPLDFQGLGINRLAEYYRRFKLDQSLGIDLPEESAGLVPTPEWKAQRYPNDPDSARWYLGNTYNASIGQGDVLVTPLHVVSWTATIANGGKVYRPYVVDRVIDKEGKIVHQNSPEVIGEIGVSQDNIRLVQEGMRQTITDGTARSLSALPITVAGKTGTAQFDARDLGRAHAWFTAYAPYEDPQIAIVVMIEDGGEGSSNSAPVAREVLRWWAENRYRQ